MADSKLSLMRVLGSKKAVAKILPCNMSDPLRARGSVNNLAST